MLNKLKTWLGIKPPKPEFNLFKYGFKVKRHNWGYSLKIGDIYQEDGDSCRYQYSYSLFIDETDDQTARDFLLFNKAPHEVTLKDLDDERSKFPFTRGLILMSFMKRLLEEEVDGKLVKEVTGTVTFKTKEEERFHLDSSFSFAAAITTTNTLSIETSRR